MRRAILVGFFGLAGLLVGMAGFDPTGGALGLLAGGGIGAAVAAMRMGEASADGGDSAGGGSDGGDGGGGGGGE